MLNNLKRTAEMLKIPVFYTSLPNEIKSLYTINPEGYEWISIDESIKGTEEEIEALSYCLGVNAAIEFIGRNNLDEISNIEKEVDKLALINQKEMLDKLYLG